MTCNTAPRVYAAGTMSCEVLNPTLQGIFPLSTNLNILRTLNPSLTPLPNVTGFGVNGSLYAQLFYDGVEQFYCNANACSQDLGSGSGSTNWVCDNLQCTCRPHASFCGGGALDLTQIIDSLNGTLTISCDAPASNGTASCSFQQAIINSVFNSGLALNGSSTDSSKGGSSLGGGVIAGLAVVGGLAGLALLFLAFGFWVQRRARRSGPLSTGKMTGVSVEWTYVSYFVPNATPGWTGWLGRKNGDFSDHKAVLDSVSGHVSSGQMMAILGPSGAGKTTLIEIIAGKNKTGHTTGTVTFPSFGATPRIGFVPQQDILPPMLTVHEALLFAARLRLPEYVRESEKLARVDDVLEKLGLTSIRDVRIGDGEKRGISGGEMRRVSIGLELVAKPDVLLLDEPTSGLDSVSASKVANVLKALAHDQDNPTVVIASIHQPSSQLYQTFDQILLLSHGRALYSGAGGFAPQRHFTDQGIAYQQGYNVADYLLDVASDPPVSIFPMSTPDPSKLTPHATPRMGGPSKERVDEEKGTSNGVSHSPSGSLDQVEAYHPRALSNGRSSGVKRESGYAATFLTQLEVLSDREWKILRRDWTLFFAHIAVSSVLGVFCGGLYFKTDITIAGFQSRVGCLFFLGALIAFSTLSALYHVVEIRPLFLRERSASYYSPTAWLLSRFVFDVIPLRVIPTIVVASITYWMAGLAHDAAHFFKFLFILVLYTLAMTLWNFLLACVFTNGGIAILLSALSALYQMTFAGFFVHLSDIPPVLRWLQWLCPLKYTLEALSVNEVGSGLMIQDTLQGVPVDVSASLIMNLLFGFGANNYYRDVLVLFAFIAGFGLGVIGVVWLRVRERR
ncbi:hypothetical protein EUX98_g2335 [Antrodiella citrinella]|uniref:ABC transporter domain-containing protein n=1 Tax=Antrodiella citrinella TaxID=2447956 RepID=A0A4V6S1X2_9APHY|nr:hypothetical protein EUX98_g2335 [Antrodiella citrinella]